ncbi:hypothetical protein IAE22_33070, partial [Bacillus sp. S34]|nr:hypothetical protein [Bacillus sp. S34]
VVRVEDQRVEVEPLVLELGALVAPSTVRAEVLRLRGTKGMVLDADDHDTWSAGSFFTNPIVSAAFAETLPTEAPRWPAGDDVKLSAAWLIEHAGAAEEPGAIPQSAQGHA